MAACAGTRQEDPRKVERGEVRAEGRQVREPAAGFRLGDGVRPLGYRVRLRVEPGEARFSGEVRVRVELGEALGRFWMHADELEVRRAVVWAEGRRVPVEIARAPEWEQIGIDWAGELGPGEVSVELEFEGRIREEDGLFRPDASVGAVYTKMRPISARRVVPSFDEPRFRTPWEVSLVVPWG